LAWRAYEQHRISREITSPAGIESLEKVTLGGIESGFSSAATTAPSRSCSFCMAVRACRTCRSRTVAASPFRRGENPFPRALVGTIPGALAVARHPEFFHDYVGVWRCGGDSAAGLRFHTQCRVARGQRAVAELKRVGPTLSAALKLGLGSNGTENRLNRQADSHVTQ
jgi:hypothetical protein